MTVPNFVGQTLDDATTLARSSGITNFAINYVKAPDRTENTVIAQNPAAGVAIPATDVVTVDVVSGRASSSCPTSPARPKSRPCVR